MHQSCFVVGALLLIVLSCYCELNPYHILNVPRNAKPTEIRIAYKELVRKWHPDKNKSPNAEKKFIEIQEAYEILSDSAKRKQYDSQGFNSNYQQQRQQRKAQSFRHSNFDDFFEFRFDDDVSAKSMTYTHFVNNVLPNSFHTPQVLFLFQSFSARDLYIYKTSWERTANDLEKLGIGVGSVNSSRISSHLRVYSTPKVVMIFEDEYYYYSGIISYENVKNYITIQLPRYLVQTVGPSSIDGFLKGIVSDDKPRALLFSKQVQPTLLYSLMAIKHKKFIKFGFVSLSDADTKSFAKNYGVRGFGPTLLIFKEDMNSPAVTLQFCVPSLSSSSYDFSVEQHSNIFKQTCFLSECFEIIKIRLCAIFVSNDQWASHQISIDNLRQVVSAAYETDDQLSEWLKFVFVINAKQQEFVLSLSGQENLPNAPVLYLLWRRGLYRSWISTFSSKFLESDVSLEYGFQKFLANCLQASNQRQFEREIRLSPLIDELAPYLISRLASQAWKKAVGLIGYIRSRGEQEIMLILIAVVVVVLTMISKAFEKPNEHLGRDRRSGSSNSTPPFYEEQRHEDDEVEDDIEVEVASSDEENEAQSFQNLRELRPGSYDDLVLRQKRGYMTIVVLLDRNDQVTNSFIELMEKYKSDKHLSFAFLKISSYLSWYLELRNASSPEPPKSQEQSSRNGLSSLHSGASSSYSTNNDVELTSSSAHGRVLALNGSKHWYCLFVPRSRRQRASGSPAHAANSSVDDLFSSGDYNSATEEETYKESASSTNNTQSPFVSDSSSEYSANLSLWIDRVQDGQFPRLYVRQWPGLYARTPDVSDSEDD